MNKRIISVLALALLIVVLAAGTASAKNQKTPEPNPGKAQPACEGSGTGASVIHYGSIEGRLASESEPGSVGKRSKSFNEECRSF